MTRLRFFATLLFLTMFSTPATAIDLPLARLTASPDLAGPTVRGVGVASDGERVAYLRSADDDRFRQDLWIFERASGRSRRLIDTRSLGADHAPSPEEAARRERERTAGLSGIGHFEWSADGQSLVFAVGDSLWLATLRGDGEPDVKRVAQGAGLIDPRLSPKAHYLAFVQGQNLHIVDLRTGQRRQLTRDGKGTVHNAEAEFIAQEEMDEPRGYWWSPDESMIAFKRFDEATVPIHRRFEINADGADVVEQHYPFAGGPNVAIRMGIVSIASGRVRWMPLGAQPDPYIARVAWLPDSRSVSYQLVSRDQKRLDLWTVDAKTMKQSLLHTDTSLTWIELHDDLRFLRTQPAFVWAADREGRKHLELIGLDGRTMHAITAGDWQVDELLAVDEEAGLVWLAGDTGTSMERHVYSVKLDGSTADRPTRVSDSGGWHVATFAESASPPKLWVDRYSDPATPPQVSVRDLQGHRLAWIEENAVDERHPYHPYADRHRVPEFGTLKADDGTLLNYSVLRPPGFDPALRYPVLLYTYGGPAAQVVTRHWDRPLFQVIAQRGYIVFMLDNRGSSRRGRAFSDAIYHRLGDVEVRDQLTGLQWLDGQPGVDKDRIGVFGWSYGGYMTLMLLAKAPPGRFAAGIAVAPVARQELYDTFYTERYLGTPQENPEGYRDSSVFGVLPNLQTPLLLMHGMADDNVLFTNTTALMAALQAQGNSFRLMTYPGGKHSLARRVDTDHVNRMIVDYLDECVKNRKIEAAP